MHIVLALKLLGKAWIHCNALTLSVWSLLGSQIGFGTFNNYKMNVSKQFFP